MIKYLEFHDPDSCWNRADHNEIVFVLLARDAAAQAAIQTWCDERIRLGKNVPGDPQILEALECSEKMADQRKRSLPAKPEKPILSGMSPSEAFAIGQKILKEKGKLPEE